MNWPHLPFGHLEVGFFIPEEKEGRRQNRKITPNAASVPEIPLFLPGRAQRDSNCVFKATMRLRFTCCFLSSPPLNVCFYSMVVVADVAALPPWGRWAFSASNMSKVIRLMRTYTPLCTERCVRRLLLIRPMKQMHSNKLKIVLVSLKDRIQYFFEKDFLSVLVQGFKEH